MRKKILRKGNVPTKYTEEIIVKTVKEYLNGTDEFDLAKQLHCHPQTITMWVSRTGNETRKRTIGYDWGMITNLVKK